MHLIKYLIVLACSIGLFACGGTPPSSNSNEYSIGGTVTGLGTGKTLVLQQSGGDDLTVSADGLFSFASKISSSSAYSVSLRNQPTNQTCLVSSPGGTAMSNVNTVAVVCKSNMVAYVPNMTSGKLSAFTINPFTGKLTLSGAPIAAGSQPVATTVTPNGKFAYVTDFGSNNVLTFGLDSNTGAVLPISHPVATGNLPGALIVDPLGKFAYIPNNGDATISAYGIDSNTGLLTPLSGSPFNVGINPGAIAMDPWHSPKSLDIFIGQFESRDGSQA